jgi:transposase
VRTIRRVHALAFLTLSFAPGECAQVDWGCAGSMSVGSTTRRLSFFVMVLCYSRLSYVEFSRKEATEHFLQAHQNAFEFFDGVPAKGLIDFVPRNKIDENRDRQTWRFQRSPRTLGVGSQDSTTNIC